MGTNHITHEAPNTTVHILADIAFWSKVEGLSNAGVNARRFFTVVTDASYGTGWSNKHTYVGSRGSLIRAKISYFFSAGNFTLSAEITLFRVKRNAFHIVKLQRGYSINLGLIYITYSFIICQTKMLVFLNFLTFLLIPSIIITESHSEH